VPPSPSRARVDDVVVGAGIVGLAHAYHLGRRGRRVLVLERSPRAVGASIRNFGMVWPIGQPLGPRRDLALRSREHWRSVLRAAGIWHDPVGSLHAAYADDEAAVLRELAKRDAPTFLSPADALARSPRLVAEGLRGAMFSETEICVDPRQVIAELPAHLSKEHGVDFAFGEAALGVEGGEVRTARRVVEASRVFVCPGDRAGGLFAREIEGAGLRLCKLQMMRTTPVPDRIGPMLAAGLTLAHYGVFRGCRSLKKLVARLDAELPAHRRFGVHVMVSQNGDGELVLGDSHVYGADAEEPFDRPEIDALVLEYLARFFALRGAEVVQRWNGTYVKHPDASHVVLAPSPEVRVVTGFGGAGMTLSFGVADEVVSMALGE